MLASSGDDGSSACLTPDGRPLPGLAVSYPASSPFVTGVGGTNFALDANNHIVSEEVWNDSPLVNASGGGGFSELFKRPDLPERVRARGPSRGPRRLDARRRRARL